MARIHESFHDEFELACTQIRNARIRPELVWQEIPSPERTVARSFALAAGVQQGSSENTALESPAGAGRFLLLGDPPSREEWGAPFRVVCYAQAPLEIEIGLDPFIAEVAWSWLIDALSLRGATYEHIAGTATKVLSEGFGQLAPQGKGAQLELRASWTPTGTDFSAHAEAWSEVLCSLAGFPHQEGTVSLDALRHTRRQTDI